MVDKGTTELDDTDRNGLLKATEGEDNHSHDRRDVDLVAVVKEETTGVCSADGVGPEAIEP